METPAKVPAMDARAIIERVNNVLVVRTRDDEPYPGVWTFPGGPVKPGDSPEVSLPRICASGWACRWSCSSASRRSCSTYRG